MIILDEVHERSAEIDACIALIALASSRRQHHTRFPKIILSSATFDDKLIVPLANAGLNVRTIGSFQQSLNNYIVREHYGDCTGHCSICHQLRKSVHHIDMVAFLSSRLQVGEQLLCFLPTTKDVVMAVEILRKSMINAVALHAQVSKKQQEYLLKNSVVFISTNVAETSLTFPSLRYVVDGGRVLRKRQDDVQVVDACMATLRQRRGRLGRTMDGDYVALYSRKSMVATVRDEHITPQMELQPTRDLRYTLQLQLLRHMPVPRTQSVFLSFPTMLMEVSPFTSDDHFSFPMMGGHGLAEAFLAAQSIHQCGYDILCFAAMHMSFPQWNVLQELATRNCSSSSSQGGDISEVILVLRKMIMAVPKLETPKQVLAYCNRQGLSKFSKYLYNSKAKFHHMVEFYLSTTMSQRQLKWATNSASVIRALAAGYSANYFIHCGCLHGMANKYSRLSDDGQSNNRLYTIHNKSTLGKLRGDAIPQLVFALGASVNDVEAGGPRTYGILQLVERVSSPRAILDSLQTQRLIELHSDDPCDGTPLRIMGQRYLPVIGPVCEVAATLLSIEDTLVLTDEKVAVTKPRNSALQSQFESNLHEISRSRSVFQPLKYYWQNTYGLKVEIHLGNKSDPHFLVSGRRKHIDLFKKHIEFWNFQLKDCPSITTPGECT